MFVSNILWKNRLIQTGINTQLIPDKYINHQNYKDKYMGTIKFLNRVVYYISVYHKKTPVLFSNLQDAFSYFCNMLKVYTNITQVPNQVKDYEILFNQRFQFTKNPFNRLTLGIVEYNTNFTTHTGILCFEYGINDPYVLWQFKTNKIVNSYIHPNFLDYVYISNPNISVQQYHISEQGKTKLWDTIYRINNH